MAENRDSVANTLTVAVGVSLVCSILVATASVMLKPRQQINETSFRQQIVLDVAGIYTPGMDIAEQFAAVDTRLVDLASGDYVTTMNADDFDAIAASSDQTLGIAIPAEFDIAGLRRRAIYSPVYLIRENGDIRQVILPVYGPGLWSTMYGYLALAPDGRTVIGLRFYQHAETPGLGDQVESAEWLAKWPGKQIFDDHGEVRIEVVRGQAGAGDDLVHKVDGMSGATLTGR
ncbi:MAG: Na(+)-translocating NADH-quinone reductase subunit C, partial [Gammaproteobacteria bacterium]|nr:Na(+)-translocating NADH-quinone reductase subunit C [Gammaproteobacteria bacterium]